MRECELCDKKIEEGNDLEVESHPAKCMLVCDSCYGEIRECDNCNRAVHKDEAVLLMSYWFCDEYCMGERFEELERKAEAFENIRTELGVSNEATIDKVVEEAINTAQELTMRKEGFK